MELYTKLRTLYLFNITDLYQSVMEYTKFAIYNGIYKIWSNDPTLINKLKDIEKTEQIAIPKSLDPIFEIIFDAPMLKAIQDLRELIENQF
jgi:hypothetical protein